MENTGARQPMTIGGIRWRAIESSTLDHDFYVTRKAEAAGVRGAVPNKGESHTAMAERLLWKIMESGLAFDLLAGMLLPVEMLDDRWTEELALKHSEFFRRLTGKDDKDVILGSIVAMLIGFFDAGRASLPPSAIASPAAMEGAPGQEKASAPAS